MWKDFLYYTKTERQGIIVLVVLILGVYAAPKLFSFFTHAEDTDCRENEKFDKEYNTKSPVILFNHPLKGKSNLRCSIRTSQTLLLFFRLGYHPG